MPKLSIRFSAVVWSSPLRLYGICHSKKISPVFDLYFHSLSPTGWIIIYINIFNIYRKCFVSQSVHNISWNTFHAYISDIPSEHSQINVIHISKCHNSTSNIYKSTGCYGWHRIYTYDSLIQYDRDTLYMLCLRYAMLLTFDIRCNS